VQRSSDNVADAVKTIQFSVSSITLPHSLMLEPPEFLTAITVTFYVDGDDAAVPDFRGLTIRSTNCVKGTQRMSDY